MLRSIRWAALLSALVLAPALSANTLQAQGRPMEIRLDFIGVETSDGDTFLNLEFPGSVALAFYMTPQFAIEPKVFFANFSSDDVDGSFYGAGLFFPFYLTADNGKSGFFISPGLELSGGSGDFDQDSQVDYGIDLGVKNPVRENISLRFALTLRDGDSYNKAAFGATFGIGLHWR